MASSQPLYRCVKKQLSSEIFKFQFAKQGGGNLRWREMLSLWKNPDNLQFFHAFNNCFQIEQTNFDGYFFYCPPLTNLDLENEVEFVLKNVPHFSKLQPDSQTYDEYFNQDLAVSFLNLGGDSLLISPCPKSNEENYTHLAKFMRGAPFEQRIELWKKVSIELEQQLQNSENPVWLNTDGSGVHWLHIRLDSRPKYYDFKPYRSRDFY